MAYYDFTIEVSLIENHGSFGRKPERQETFRLCAASRDEAISLASANVESQGHPYDSKQIQVTGALPV